MKRFTKCVCFFLVVATLLTAPAFAAETATPWSSNFFFSSCLYLEKLSIVRFQIWIDVVAVRGMDELGASVVKVQRSSDGVNWTTMKTFTKEDHPNMISTDTAFHTSYLTYSGTEGYYYRAFIVLYAKNGSGIGECYEYTDPILL